MNSTIEKVERARDKFLRQMTIIKVERESLNKKEIEIIETYLEECQLYEVRSLFSKIKGIVLRKEKDS